MKTKTQNLTGPALDWAVAKCEGINLFETEGWFYSDGKRAPFRPSSDWRQGGPIIEREKLTVGFYGHGHWVADPDGAFEELGDTPLVAAMRCYVASKLGDEVEAPDELL